MKPYSEFLESRKNLNMYLKIRNTVSCILLFYLGLLVFKTFTSSLNEPVLKICVLMAVTTASLCSAIFVVKVRTYRETRKNNLSLHEYIKAAIKEARTNHDYKTLNQLLDSKYSVHSILVMSSYPLDSFDFGQLSKWSKLPEAISYFKKNNFKEDDLNDSEKMVGYLRAVYPEFLTALSQNLDSTRL